FFFQAEDGIRDDLVTGVQTCALPICAALAGRLFEVRARCTAVAADRARTRPDRRWSPRNESAVREPLAVIEAGIAASKASGAARSEERRVGKGRGWTWGTNQGKIEEL